MSWRWKRPINKTNMTRFVIICLFYIATTCTIRKSQRAAVPLYYWRRLYKARTAKKRIGMNNMRRNREVEFETSTERKLMRFTEDSFYIVKIIDLIMDLNKRYCTNQRSVSDRMVRWTQLFWLALHRLAAQRRCHAGEAKGRPRWSSVVIRLRDCKFIEAF